MLFLQQQNMEEDSEMLVPHSEEAVVEGPQPMEGNLVFQFLLSN